MATYVIGDVHGCHETLQRLTRRMQLDFRSDRVWLVGDLVNRGPGSLPALRWAIEHEDRITMVLGNHDLHLLAVAAGAARERKKDTLREILEARDHDDLLGWVRSRPLLVRDGPVVLVHAGLRPVWTVAEAEVRARAAEELLRSDRSAAALRVLRNRDAPRDKSLGGALEDLDFLTRVRMIDERGEPDYAFTGPPEQAPDGLRPWFDPPERRSRDHRILFGHWAALGYRDEPGILALDSGCVWGGHLTGIRLDDGKVFREVSELRGGLPRR